MLVTLVDEMPGAGQHPRGTLSIAAPPITVRDLIRARLELEQESIRHGDPTGRSAEKWLVAPRRRGPAQPAPNLEQMTEAALAGFMRGSFLLLVQGRQATAPDEVITLAEATEAVFLRLVPLQGG